MSTAQTLVIHSTSFEDTVSLAERIGNNMRGGEVVELVSDIGGGKTAFVSGLVKGLGIKDVVSSPSFTLNNVYQGKQLTINHYDLYRLSQPGIMKHEIAEATADPQTVVAIEWGETVQDVLPAERLTVALQAIDESEREVTLKYPSSISYLVKGIEG